MKRFVCVVCPKSCELTIETHGGDLSVAGNECERGVMFASGELHNPQRVLTATVKLASGGLLPVRSRGTVSKGELKAIVERLKSVTVTPPVEIGQIVFQSTDEASSDIIASDAAMR